MAVEAQAVANAQVSGHVTDPTGAPVPGATVTLTETDRNVTHSATTNASGAYTLPNLPVGPYRLTVTAPRFKNYVQSGIVLQVGDTPVINVPLQIGSVNQTIEVSAAASMVGTDQVSVSQVINQKQIVDLPLNGRQPTQLVLISGAAVATPGGDMTGSKNYWSSTTISVGGGQANGTNYLLDGGNNIDTMTDVNLPFPFPDALQEFSVDSNALPARNGEQPGGVVNIVTKSGTNAFHGGVFEFIRNGDLNARNYFGTTHDLLKRNQFGGTLGGPIVRDRLFFFGGYQGTRIRNVSPSAVAYVPTAAELAGNFTTAESPACVSGRTSARPIYVPNTKTPIRNLTNVFTNPGVTIDPAALALAKYLPSTSDPCGRITYSIPSIQDEDQYVGRIDWAQSAKHNFFGRYFYTRYDAPAFFDPHNVLVTTNPGNLESSMSATLGDTYTFSPTVLNSFHATFTRRTDFRGPNSQFFNARDLGINMFVNVPDDFRLAVSNGGFSVGCGTCSPAHLNVNTYQFSDDVDVIRSIHRIGFGAEYIRTQNNLLTGYLQNGSFSFNGSATGDPILDYLTGTLSGFSQSLPQQPTIRMTIPALYFQDTIRLSSRLTLNAGVRWQPMLWPQDYFHRGASFSMANFLSGVHSKVYPNAPAGALYYGDPGITASFTNDRKAIFSPRFGVAFDPQGNGRQTIRLGGGIMYDPGMLYTAQRLASDPPFVNEIDLAGSNPGGFSNPWTVGYNYPGGNPFPPNGAYFPQAALWIVLPNKLKPTTLYQWNATYQIQIKSNWLVSASYLANKTSHIWVGQELNPAVYSPSVCAGFKKGCSTANTNQRRVLNLLNPAQGQYYGGLDILDDGANANYNALLVSVQRRLANGVTFLSNYTWSHCISEADFGGDITGPGFMNPYNLAEDRGDCNFDIRHIFNTSIVATSSFGNHGIWSALLSNWQIAPLVRALSGVPLNVTTGVDASLTGINLDRPNLAPGVDPYTNNWGPNLQYLNPAAFVRNAPGTYGNLGRDSLRGPGQLEFDASLSRIFALHESLQLEVRAEAFNVINHTNFIAPATGTGIPGISTGGISLGLTSSIFGRITTAGDPRILQFAMKLNF
ncbi:MAG TPA: carboxypeptidase regulatory-like domain-containing protein [Bryobacteraceae bacterium]|nr:carboxypeptidase regulatory-like domain-containing protein [Bryobacteraceae bacterium]